MVCRWAVAVCEKYLTPVTTTPNVSDAMDTALVPIVLSSEIGHHTNANLPLLKPDPEPPLNISLIEGVIVKSFCVNRNENIKHRDPL